MMLTWRLCFSFDQIFPGVWLRSVLIGVLKSEAFIRKSESGVSS